MSWWAWALIILVILMTAGLVWFAMDVYFILQAVKRMS